MIDAKLARPAQRRWSKRELGILRKNFPLVGAPGCIPLLPRRSENGIRSMAMKLNLVWEDGARHRGLTSPVPVDDLPRVLAMHKAGRSHDEIAAAFNICAASAANALAAAKCRAAGRQPAKRASDGSLMIRDLKRLHAMQDAGARGVDIQIELGISASSVSTYRRRREAELAAQGLPPLPPPGGGARYCGRKLTKAERKEIENLYMEGYGSKIITRRLGVGQTAIKRVRDRLIRKLKRKGELLPGCDENGKRLKFKEPARKVKPEAIAALRAHLLDRVPVQRAARFTGIGISTAYKLRDQFAAELAALGHELPKPKLPGKSAAGRAKQPHVPAMSRKLTFDEQLQRIREGATLVPKFVPSADISQTLGGVGSGML